MTVTELGFTERVVIKVEGFAAGTALDFFIIQVPHAPFGVSWYMADLDIGSDGSVTKTFVTRANEETFAVAPGGRPPRSRTVILMPAPIRRSSRSIPSISASGSTRRPTR